MQKKYTRSSPTETRGYRVDVISSIAWDIPPCLPPLFWNVTKTRSECDRPRERLMRTTRERTNGRRAVRDFRTLAYICRAARVQSSDCYMSTAGIVIATPAANPASTFTCVHVCTCNLELHPSTRSRMSGVSERASERANFSWHTRGTSIPVSSTYFYNLRQYGDR